MHPPPEGDVRLGWRRWPELAEAERTRPLVLVPVGSLEQHGPALPLATDTLLAGHVAHEAAKRRVAEGDRVVVAPAVSYGASGEHEGFPGTISIGHDALRLLLVEFGRSACQWADGLIFVNGHGGNVATLVDAVGLLREEGRPVAWTACRARDTEGHAGEAETSVLLALAPGSVRRELLAPGDTTPMARLLPRLREVGVRAVSPSGVLGDPTTATPERGRRILAEMVDGLVAELAELDVGEHGRLTAPVPGPA